MEIFQIIDKFQWVSNSFSFPSETNQLLAQKATNKSSFPSGLTTSPETSNHLVVATYTNFWKDEIDKLKVVSKKLIKYTN